MDKNYFLTENAYQEIIGKLNNIELQLKMSQGIEDVFLDNQQFIQMMNISKRTAQTWRDQNIIPFSMVGNKIYYQMKDVRTLLAKNYHSVINF
ncbi:helix-turn-helix domain-containing protein [Pedobacter cryophilus]|uniref:Helix-turn-helix domain-containing protein n=1 Tax=Pedobacter cryophilus TaxID=2571271 RepID=A0A4U1C714_9SPHI|nr:helix-turn-helix domain-containing protein [Pedobacter cryophilus]TKC00177.1 helix-turn-helix domain-containing protein [Pedobacter cryophilus]